MLRPVNSTLHTACPPARVFLLATALAATAASAARAVEATADDARIDAFESTVAQFADHHEVSAVSYCVSRGGTTLVRKALGFADEQKTVPLTPDTRFRIASVSKPVTAAAVKTLIRDGKLSADDRVTKILAPPAWPAPTDGRWNDITIHHLLEHRGGWDRAKAGDPMFMAARIREETGRYAARPDDVVRWMMTQPLQFDPGGDPQYSNFGYCTLGRVLEAKTGEPYLPFIRKTIAGPCGIASWDLSLRGREHARTNEVWYDMDGGGEDFDVGLMDAHGGLISTAEDLCRFMAKYWLTGDSRQAGARGAAVFYGSLPGTTAIAVQRPDGLDYAVLLNKRGRREEWHSLLHAALDAALDASRPAAQPPAGPPR
jgi:CubicO group peptidase (beta-lactamase class C family)